MDKINVLLIDDDEKLAKLLREYFEGFGITLTAAVDADAGLKQLKKQEPALVILDVMLPGRDGFAVCREIRSQSDVPILMLTARGEPIDRVAGLEIGADDYVAKPFEPRELVARIQTILRRTKGRGASNVVKIGPFVLDPSKRQATNSGKEIDLTTMEYELLKLFLENVGKKFTRDEIMNHLQGFDSNVFSRSVDILVSRLRGKIEANPKTPEHLKTVWGTGYVFVGESDAGS